MLYLVQQDLHDRSEHGALPLRGELEFESSSKALHVGDAGLQLKDAATNPEASLPCRAFREWLAEVDQ